MIDSAIGMKLGELCVLPLLRFWLRCRNSLTCSNTQQTKSLSGISEGAYRSVKIRNLVQNRVSTNTHTFMSKNCVDV